MQRLKEEQEVSEAIRLSSMMPWTVYEDGQNLPDTLIYSETVKRSREGWWQLAIWSDTHLLLEAATA